jgi:hypothetical protein
MSVFRVSGSINTDTADGWGTVATVASCLGGKALAQGKRQ